LQRSQANMSEESSCKPESSQTLAPPTGTQQYPVRAAATHVQTTFLRGDCAAELYLALYPALYPDPLSWCPLSSLDQSGHGSPAVDCLHMACKSRGA
jgi:hypothetical protein